MSVPLRVRWTPRILPLEPLAVFAVGSAGRDLAARAMPRSGLRGVRFSVGTLVIGESSLLPWVDGAKYLGFDEGGPQLLVPTALEPSVPIDWVDRALRQRHELPRGRLVYLPQEGLCLAAMSTLPVGEAFSEALLDEVSHP